MPDQPGRDLLQRFVHGDGDAFEALFRQFEREVHRWILRIVREPDAADDALIEAFWRAYRSRARFDPSRSFGPWMRRIATRAAIDQLHAGRRRWQSLGEAAGSPSPDRLPASRESAEPGTAQAIARAFASLPAAQRVVATLALIEERPLAEIAAALDVPVGTVKSRLFRATRCLRAELARMGVRT